jgi:hypothetical protein
MVGVLERLGLEVVGEEEGGEGGSHVERDEGGWEDWEDWEG